MSFDDLPKRIDAAMLRAAADRIQARFDAGENVPMRDMFTPDEIAAIRRSLETIKKLQAAGKTTTMTKADMDAAEFFLMIVGDNF